MKLNLEMEFAVNCLSSSVDHLESVATVAVHVTVAERHASTTEQKRHLVCGLRSKAQEVPEHIRILSRQFNTQTPIKHGTRKWLTNTYFFYRTAWRHFVGKLEVTGKPDRNASTWKHAHTYAERWTTGKHDASACIYSMGRNVIITYQNTSQWQTQNSKTLVQ